jgi:hypothetical protein
MASNTTVLLKKSGVSGNTPSDLAYGEVALNYAEGKLFYKNGVGIKSITNQKTFSTINANNTLILAGSYTDTVDIIGGRDISVVGDAINKKITISYTGTGGGGGGGGTGNGFTQIIVPSGDVVESTTNTAIQFKSGPGVSIAANVTDPTSVTFSVLPGAQGLTVDWGFITDTIGLAYYDFGSNLSL